MGLNFLDWGGGAGASVSEAFAVSAGDLWVDLRPAADRVDSSLLPSLGRGIDS